MKIGYSPISFGAKRLLPDNLRAVASQVTHGDIDKADIITKATTELIELQKENSSPTRRGDLKGLLRKIGAEDVLRKLTGNPGA